MSRPSGKKRLKRAFPDYSAASTTGESLPLLSEMPEVSVVILNYNSGKFVLDCIESVQRFTRSCEIVVVDNGSTDGSVEKILELFPSARVVRNNQNLGFARANNIGIRQTTAKYVVLMNSDVEASANWWDHLKKCVDGDPCIGVATPKLLKPDGRLDSTGHIFRFFELWAKNRGSEEQDVGQYDENIELLSCDFACVIIKKSLLDRIGLLDEKIFFYHEDIDFCLRARSAGWRVIFCPNSIVYHHRSASTSDAQMRSFTPPSRRYLTRLALKTYSRRSLYRLFLYKWRKLLLSLLGVLAGLRNRDPSYSTGKLNEVLGLFVIALWNILHLPIKERIFIQSRRVLSDDDLLLLARTSMLSRLSKS